MNSYRSKPYDERTDLEKVLSSWKKLAGLYDRGEWSSVVVRAATAAEIAANLVVREELIAKRELESDFVDYLLIWANGLYGKIEKIILPLLKDDPGYAELKALKQNIKEINTERNKIVHGGYFKDKEPAKKIVAEARTVIETFVKRYEEDFELPQIETN